MIVQAFLKWAATAAGGQRVRAAEALAEAYVTGDLTAEDRNAAEAAMMFLLDDPLPKVRLALAHVLASYPQAPRPVIRGLARDQLSVAVLTVSCSPVLNDADLVDLVADGRPSVQAAVASRIAVPMTVSAAIAEIAPGDVVADLLDNPAAVVAPVSMRRMAERFADDPQVRARLLDRPDLPADARHGLILRLGDALARHGLFAATIGGDRLERVTHDACRSATLRLAAEAGAHELPALVEHLRLSGRITPSFLMDALCRDQFDLFAAIIANLAGGDLRRVRTVLLAARGGAVRALLRKSGLAEEVVVTLVEALALRKTPGGVGAMRAGLPARLAGRAQSSDLASELRLLVERFARNADDDERRLQVRALLPAA